MSNNALNNDDLLEESIASDPAPTTANLETEREVPAKYKGKSVFDLIGMHQNSERKISEQGRELGDLRRATDEMLGFKKDNAPKEKKPVTSDELFTDPDKAVNKAIEQSDVAERASKIADRIDTLERSIGQKEFEGKFPSFMEDVQDPDFQSWVRANRARASLLVELNNNYNFDAGTALWEMWDEFKSAPKVTPKPNKQKQVQDASTVRSAPAEGVRKPVFSRAKLADLQARAVRGDRAAQMRWNDPAFQKEYHEAYAEGRVR